jgi:poly(hydroxyalkanoate) granule-associated protein
MSTTKEQAAESQVRNNSIFRLGELPENVKGMVDRAKALPKELADDATARGRDVWLAGLGAFAMAEEQGSALFNNLVKQGEELVKRGATLEERGRKQIDAVKKDIDTRRDQVADRIEDSREMAENAIYEPVIAAMQRIGMPTRAEVEQLSGSVASLTQQVNALLAKLEAQTATQRTVFSVKAGETGWTVEKLGDGVPSGIYATKDEALEAGRALANANLPSQLVVYRKDGTIQDTLTYDA